MSGISIGRASSLVPELHQIATQHIDPCFGQSAYSCRNMHSTKWTAFLFTAYILSLGLSSGLYLPHELVSGSEAALPVTVICRV